MATVTKGKSFSFSSDDLENVGKYFTKMQEKQEKRVAGAVKKGTDMAWQIAHQKRPMLSKADMKAQGRTHRVSDPNAKLGVPVQTGQLQASIQKSVTSKFMHSIGHVWTDLYYAKFVEYGTSKMQARPFMRPALALVREAMKGLVKAT